MIEVLISSPMPRMDPEQSDDERGIIHTSMMVTTPHVLPDHFPTRFPTRIDAGGVRIIGGRLGQGMAPISLGNRIEAFLPGGGHQVESIVFELPDQAIGIGPDVLPHFASLTIIRQGE